MSNNVLINDNFISKRADFNTLVDACKGFTHTLDNQQDFLSFELDDIQRLELIPGGFYTFGNYTWNPENPDPMLEEMENGQGMVHFIQIVVLVRQMNKLPLF